MVVVTQEDGSTTVQSYMAQCVQQKIQYNKQTLPRRIEEALEEYVPCHSLLNKSHLDSVLSPPN